MSHVNHLELINTFRVNAPLFFNASQSSAANPAEYWGALVQPTVNIRVVFRTQSSICNEAFFAFARQLFLQKKPHRRYLAGF